MHKKIGIASIGLSIPSLAISMNELAKLRGANVNKYTVGLGCKAMSLCPKDVGVINLAETAAKRALQHWSHDASKIGMIVVGSESGLDMSRPLSSWVMELLGLQGAIRTYEVKHACFGGTLALRQALEWKLSGNSKGLAALVIAVDQGLYAPGHPGEPTQGAGASAFIIDEAIIAEIDPISYAWSRPEYDFWRPIGVSYPKVNGPLSLQCYNQSAIECYKQLIDSNDLKSLLDKYAYLCFHVPFPRMVQKAFAHLGEYFGLSKQTIDTYFNEKIAPVIAWNAYIGNCYTASLWFCVANALAKAKKDELISAFSYGSGFGSELLTLKACSTQTVSPVWEEQLIEDFSKRKFITAEEYEELRESSVTFSMPN